MTRITNYLLQKWYFPLILQLLTLVAFAFLIIGGLAADANDVAFAKVLRNTNLANLIVWSYWWPLIILFAIGLGRIWCMVCPMELVTKLAALIGFRRHPPKWLRSGWVITIFYFLILVVGIHTLAIHRIPYRMGLYMLMLLCTAVITGLIFSRTTFCAYVCPVGYLLGLYARLAPLGWGVHDQNICRLCKDRSCISGKNADHFLGHSCGVWLYPPRITDNASCLLCGQCLKACNQDNPGWFKRAWFKDLFALKPLSSSQVSFCLIVSGFVIYEIVTEWSVSKAILMYAPEKLQSMLGVADVWAYGLIKSLSLFVVLPAFIWLFPYAVFRMVGGKNPLGSYLQQIAIVFIPIMAAMHALKSLMKITSRIPYWEYSVGDPVGITTAQGIAEKSLHLSSVSGWREPMITVLSVALLAAGVSISLVVVHKILKNENEMSPFSSHAVVFYLTPVLYGGIFGAMLIAWRFH